MTTVCRSAESSRVSGKIGEVSSRSTPRLKIGTAVASLLALAWLTGCAEPGGVNVLLVVLDTTRADAVSAYGDPASATPTLDSLASEGVRYARARSTSGWTVPSHGSLFTGLYPSGHGARHGSLALRADAVTLAELLQRTHDTAGFSENPHIRTDRGWAQGFGVYLNTWRWRAEEYQRLGGRDLPEYA